MDVEQRYDLWGKLERCITSYQAAVKRIVRGRIWAGDGCAWG